MKVLVVGGAGYIGSVMSKVLLEAGHAVTVFDSLALGHRAAVPRGAGLIVADLSDPAAIERACVETRPDCVMHFAARSLVGESVDKPELYFYNNVACGVNLLNACVRARMPRFVFSSSAAVYGAPERVPIAEDAPLSPVNPYGSSKKLFESLLEEYAKAGGPRYASLRYFNVAGAYAGLGEDHRPETHLIPRICQAALRTGECFEIYGDTYETRDGTCIRDYIHVLDLCRAHLLAMEAIDDRDLVYNLGSESGYTVREVFATAEKVIARKIDCRLGACRPGDPPALVASSAKIRRELNWRAEKSLEQMIADAWEWHCEHPDGYAD